MTKKNRAIRLNNEGNDFYRHRQFDAAIQCYSKALAQFPDFSQFFGNRGQAYYQIRKYKEAVDDSLRAVELDPNFWKGYVRAGKGLIKLGRLAEAAGYFRQAAKYTWTYGEPEGWARIRDPRGYLPVRVFAISGDGPEATVVEDCHVHRAPDTQQQDRRLRLRAGDTVRVDDEAAQIARFELGRCEMLQVRMEEVRRLYQERSYAACVEAIQELEESIPQCFELKDMLCECQYQRKKYNTVLKITSAIKDEMHLQQKDLQHVTNLEMKAFAAVTAQRMNLLKAVKERREQREREGTPASAAAARRDLYAVLGVEKRATEDEVANAYTKLALKFHPDRQAGYLSEPERRELKARFMEVTEAFVVLSDAATRDLYDCGYAVEDILSEDLDPLLVFCGVVPEPSEASLGARAAYHVKRACFWAVSPLVAAATCPCWTAWCVKGQLCQGADEDWWDEQRHSCLTKKRERMRQHAVRRRDADGSPRSGGEEGAAAAAASPPAS
eukprot:TRINITY_DN70028_c0_g1_i1.p1 TRINITY_DN70028_c0_g1~~TRINITY_DN70028_c0_g1_i1.p1  ORF type:complete len:527 (+),score=180.71 TRINITY_DN70028_c0_g1_i1:90-1583(+)